MYERSISLSEVPHVPTILPTNAKILLKFNREQSGTKKKSIPAIHWNTRDCGDREKKAGIVQHPMHRTAKQRNYPAFLYMRANSPGSNEPGLLS